MALLLHRIEKWPLLPPLVLVLVVVVRAFWYISSPKITKKG